MDIRHVLYEENKRRNCISAKWKSTGRIISLLANTIIFELELDMKQDLNGKKQSE